MRSYKKPVIEIENILPNVDLAAIKFETAISLENYDLWNDVFGPIP